MFGIAFLIPIDALWVFGPKCSYQRIGDFGTVPSFPIPAAILRDQLFVALSPGMELKKE
jgi:hypothetical protein